MEGNLVNPAYANDGTILENHADAGLDPILEDYVDVETVPTIGNHVDEVTFIPKNHIDKETVHIRTSMLTEV